MPEIVVIGAGISGLTVAHKLARAGKDVLVLEGSSNVGGKIVTERVEGYLLESGPNSLRVENQETIDLLTETQLSNRILEANPASKMRYVLKSGNWIVLPHTPLQAISTALLSPFGKLRVLAEPFISKTSLFDEPVSSFVRRRLGREIFEYGADPFITGIYAGDPERLSMRYAFNSMWSAEQTYGSLIAGLIKSRSKKTARIRPAIVSFPNGLSELTAALRISLKTRLHLHTGALSVERSGAGYTIFSSDKTFEAEKIIFTLPAYHIAGIIAPLSSAFSEHLRGIFYPPVAVVFLGYADSQFEKLPTGFGGLIPSKEKRDILGIIFSSSNFPGRAPSGRLLLTVLMGGAKRMDIAGWEDEEILSAAIREVTALLKPNGEPVFHSMKRWPRAIPQYNIGYNEVLHAIEAMERDHPGLFFLGNYRGGISMGACIRNATELAKMLV